MSIRLYITLQSTQQHHSMINIYIYINCCRSKMLPHYTRDRDYNISLQSIYLVIITPGSSSNLTFWDQEIKSIREMHQFCLGILHVQILGFSGTDIQDISEKNTLNLLLYFLAGIICSIFLTVIYLFFPVYCILAWISKDFSDKNT